jgi:hypothetical protein
LQLARAVLLGQAEYENVEKTVAECLALQCQPAAAPSGGRSFGPSCRLSRNSQITRES